MRKTQKKLLGLLGLVLVVVMTVFAAFLPNPGASATTEVVDTIQIRVLDEIPAVSIGSLESGEVISSLDEIITANYVNIKSYILTAEFVSDDENTNGSIVVIADVSEPDPAETGEKNYSFRPAGKEFGYGKYIIKLSGVGLDGSAVEDTIEIEYAAITIEATTNDDNGTVDVHIGYDTNDEDLDEDETVSKVVINVYDENGNLVDGLSPVTVNSPEHDITLDFDKYGLPSGKYTIVAQAYNANGDKLYREVKFVIDYSEPIVVPDTGGALKGLNISKTDYLITGVSIFLIVGIAGVIFINKRSKQNTRRRRK